MLTLNKFFIGVFMTSLTATLSGQGDPNILLVEQCETPQAALKQVYPDYVSDSELHYDTFKMLEVTLKDGRKFARIYPKGRGMGEYRGVEALKGRFPVIPVEKVIVGKDFELIVHPYHSPQIRKIAHLFHHVVLMVCEGKDCTPLIRTVYADALKVHKDTMAWKAQPSRNAHFFYNRLLAEGRLETIYKNQTLLNTPWEKFKTMHWTIDGVEYKETLAELLANAKVALDPTHPRLFGLSHGDPHENNIVVKPEGMSVPYAYTHAEFGGENDLLTDAMMTLLYTTVYGDYLDAVFHRDHYEHNLKIDEYITKTKQNKAHPVTVNRQDDQFVISDAGAFGTLKTRKELAALFINEYFDPLLAAANAKFIDNRDAAIQKNMRESMENTLKAGILLRLIAGSDISKKPPNDQAKIFVLVYKTLGTPKSGATNERAVTRLMNAL